MSVLESNRKIVVGDIAHGSTDTGQPVGLGAFARSIPPTAVANNQRVRLWADLTGRLVVRAQGDGMATNTTLLNATPATDADLYVDVPASAGTRAAGFYIYNLTGLNVRIRIYIYKGVTGGYIFDRTIANGTQLVVTPGAGGEGASSSYASVPALAFNLFDKIAVRYTMTGTPSGALRIDAGTMS